MGLAMSLTACWLILIAAAELAAKLLGTEPQLCLFKRLTTLACPSCGLTRGVRLIFAGRPLQGLAMNPLFFAVIAGLIIIVVAKVLFGLKFRLRQKKRGRILAWSLAIIVFIINWCYVIGLN